MAIGHRYIEYGNEKREIIFVNVRGTNDTIEERSSNFDMGANTKNYKDRDNKYWRNKDNHKGFDVAANYIYDEIIKYEAKLKKGVEKSIYITGHSRGGGIANILGAKFENNANYKPFTYTFAAPNTTTKKGNYKNIFNIINKDDLIPLLPVKAWGFEKYGTNKEISVKQKYECTLSRHNIFQGHKVGTFEWLTGIDYNGNSNYPNTVEEFGKIAENRNELYEYVCNDHNSNKNDNTNIAIYYEDTGKVYTDRMKNYSKIVKKPLYKESHQTPAFLMYNLAEMAISPIGNFIGYNVAPKYQNVKASFSATFLKGGEHPHYPEAYYLIANNKFEALK